MKKLLTVLFTVIFAAGLSAAKLPVQKGHHGYKILDSKSNYLEIEYGVRDLDLSATQTEKGAFTSVHLSNGYLTGKVGEPAELQFQNLIELPLGATPEVEVISYDTKTIDLAAQGYKHPLMPVQPSYRKDVSPAQIYTRYNENSYKANRFSNDPLATVDVSGNMRGVTIAKLSVRTTRYNPTTNQLIVMSNIRVRVKFDGNTANARQVMLNNYSPFFEGTNSYIINHSPLTKTEYNDLVKSPVTYLLVANSGLQNNAKLNEFIQWKTEKGFNVLTKFVPASESITSIDSWIETQYNSLTPKPSFVLIVGDESGTYGVKAEENPPLGSTGDVTRSDLLYGVIGPVTTNNHLPSMYVGRFSVRDLADLTAQVDKTIHYEKTQFTSGADLSYLAKAMVVAGEDASNEVKFGNPHVRYAMAYHFNNTYTNPATNTTNGVTGIPSTSDNVLPASTIINNVSQGLAYYNYTAHGSETSFGDPSFQISNINSLSNTGKYGLIIGNCCLTGSFGTAECFGEAWLNAPNKGAIGYIGSSMSTLWNEDLAMGIGSESVGDVNHAGTDVNYIPPFTPNAPGMPDGLMLMKFPTQAGVKHVGLLAVETYGGSYRDSYWSAYHLFGDPSIMLYAGVPKDMEVTHAPTVIPGSTTFTVNAVKNAYVALSDDAGVLHGAGIANENGVATVTMTPFTSGNAKLVVYAPMKKPVFKTIQVVPLDGPYMIYHSNVVSNNNYGQNCTIDLRLKNIGNATSTNLVVTPAIDAADAAFATVTSSPISFGNVAAGDSILKPASITVAISSTVPDQETIKINLNMVDNVTKKTYQGSFTFKANAPALSYSVSTGGTIMPGDNKNLVYKIKNSGHAAISTANVNLAQTTSLPITISNAQQSAASINFADSVSFTFPAQFGSTIPLGSKATFVLHLSANNGVNTTYTTDIMIGTTEVLFTEDFEGSFPPANWVNSSNPGWEQGTSDGLNGSKCASAKYTPAGIRTLTTKAINLSLTTMDTLSFWWKDDDISKISGFDTTWCEISRDGSIWEAIGLLAAGSSEDEYTKFSYALPTSYQSTTFKIRWRDKTDGSYSAYGTGVDNVQIRGYYTGVGINETAKPEVSTLFQNYPNPFNPETTIRFFNKETANVKLAIYNLKGETVANLVSGSLNQGFHDYRFNATGLASGVYIYKLQIGNQSMVKSMLLLK